MKTFEYQKMSLTYVPKGLTNDLPIWYQAIIWANDDLVDWYIYVSLSLIVLNLGQI